MGIILTNDGGSDDAFRPKPAYMKPDAVEEGKKKIKKLPADNSVGQVSMAKAQLVGGAEVRPNGMVKQEDATQMCAMCLKGLIGETLSFYMKAHAYHWNVMGPDFAQYHELFEEIYEDAHASIDPLAEYIRAMGYMAPFSMETFVGERAIKDMPVMPTPMAMSSDLYNANTIMLAKISEAYDKAEMAGQHGLSNFLAERMGMHQKWGWQLGAAMGSQAFIKEAPMKTEDGMKYPADAFAYVPDAGKPSTWKLRLWDSPEQKETKRQIGMAVAALGEGFRGNKVEIPMADRKKVIGRVRSAWNKVNDDSAEIPAVLKALEDMVDLG